MQKAQKNRWVVTCRLENTTVIKWRYYRRQDAEDCLRKSKRLIPKGQLQIMFDEEI